jgi:hypothetical protein
VRCSKWLASIYKRWNSSAINSSATTSNFKADFENSKNLPPMGRYPRQTKKSRPISMSIQTRRKSTTALIRVGNRSRGRFDRFDFNIDDTSSTPPLPEPVNQFSLHGLCIQQGSGL